MRRVSQWYEADKANLQARRDTLHALEVGGNATAEIAQMISMAVLRRHLETMQRLDIEYDFLPQESDILHLHFWAKAFELLKADRGSLLRGGREEQRLLGDDAGRGDAARRRRRAARWPGPDEDAKVIVRSNGTVGYVGKDIAYHMWKFGLLGLDFGYRKFYEYADGRAVWISCDPRDGEPGAPHFGGVGAIYNVIDARQSDPQETVKQAILLMGHEAEAARYTHFSYEMVALTPRCAMELGYAVSEEDQQRSYIEVSGRKGFGVKADDLLDKLIEAAKSEVDARQPERSEAERREIATQIAIGALRYFMLKFTKQSVIAFDFREALSFEGETGPYVQYAVVRATNIFRKAGIVPEDVLREEALKAALAGDAFDGQRRPVVAVADGGTDRQGDRAVHCHDRAGGADQTCVSTGAAVQQLLPQASHSDRRGRGTKGSAAGHGGGGAERVDGDHVGDGDSGAGGDVKRNRPVPAFHLQRMWRERLAREGDELLDALG